MTTGGTPRARVGGGAGPTRPFIVERLRERGCELTIFHRNAIEGTADAHEAHHE